jgi:hypothetical protein
MGARPEEASPRLAYPMFVPMFPTAEVLVASVPADSAAHRRTTADAGRAFLLSAQHSDSVLTASRQVRLEWGSTREDPALRRHGRSYLQWRICSSNAATASECHIGTSPQPGVRAVRGPGCDAEMPSRLRPRQICLARIPRNRGDADQLLGAVEQRGELRTGSLEDHLLNAVDSRAAHLIGRLFVPIDTVKIRLHRRIEQGFRFCRRGRTTQVMPSSRLCP